MVEELTISPPVARKHMMANVGPASWLVSIASVPFEIVSRFLIPSRAEQVWRNQNDLHFESRFWPKSLAKFGTPSTRKRPDFWQRAFGSILVLDPVRKYMPPLSTGQRTPGPRTSGRRPAVALLSKFPKEPISSRSFGTIVVSDPLRFWNSFCVFFRAFHVSNRSWLGKIRPFYSSWMWT